MMASICWNYGFGLLIKRQNQLISSFAILTIGVIGNLFLLGFFKYTDFLVEMLNQLSGAFFTRLLINQPEIHLPIGISFFTFQSISYLVDVYRGHVSPQRSLLKLALYVSLFPQLIAGPIVRYETVASELETRKSTFSNFAHGIELFVLGLARKVLIANPLGYCADQIFSLPVEQWSPGLCLLAITCYTLQIFFDFSAYSTMAIGLGKMFGFTFLENFDAPYTAQSIREFWRRWHISLSTWFRDYVYVPLGGNRRGSHRTSANLLIVFFLCGLWHGAGLNFILWGLFHGAFLALERTRFGEFMSKRARIFQHLYVLGIVMTGWVFFRLESMNQILEFFRTIFFLGSMGTVIHPLERYLQRDVLIALCAGIICSLNWKQISQHSSFLLFERSRLRELSKVLLIIGLLLLCLIRLSAEQYNPFIYYRF
ncbi:MAG: MBOAT family O-acyltransferase [Candidatus Sumerlaeia bacterium]|nr:MBOAT family O-acyltransferase [Candidatus Sumerlaeia bacterium]